MIEKLSSNSTPLVSIITPVLNGEKYLEQAILSVLNQQYKNIEHIIIDGGSTDNTINIIKKYEEHISCWVSEPDGGIYDAISKGVKKAKGKWVHWLNADDMLMPWSVNQVIKYANSTGARWIAGIPSWIDEYGNTTTVGAYAWQPRSLIRRGAFYGKGAGFLQQESIYFETELFQELTSSDLDRFKSFKLAGDYWLWRKFSEKYALRKMPAVIGSFRVTQENMSVRYENVYDDEVAGTAPLGRWTRFLKPLLFGVGLILGILEKRRLDDPRTESSPAMKRGKSSQR